MRGSSVGGPVRGQGTRRLALAVRTDHDAVRHRIAERVGLALVLETALDLGFRPGDGLPRRTVGTVGSTEAERPHRVRRVECPAYVAADSAGVLAAPGDALVGGVAAGHRVLGRRAYGPFVGARPGVGADHHLVRPAGQPRQVGGVQGDAEGAVEEGSALRAQAGARDAFAQLALVLHGLRGDPAGGGVGRRQDAGGQCVQLPRDVRLQLHRAGDVDERGAVGGQRCAQVPRHGTGAGPVRRPLFRVAVLDVGGFGGSGPDPEDLARRGGGRVLLVPAA